MEIKTNQYRIQSIDVLRGLVMIIMAIDHVRVYSGVLPGGPSPDVFFTRWITHFCAPTFAFLAGTSAFLFFNKSGNRSEVVRFLLTRGFLLVILEMTVIRFFWMFNFQLENFNMTGVIWMLGWCMILLAVIIKFHTRYIGIIGLVIIAAQQIFHYVPALFPSSMQQTVANFWAFFYPSLVAPTPAVTIVPGLPALPTFLGVNIFYVIIPWIGVMMAGFGFGQFLLKDKAELRKICLRIGITAIVLFISAATITILLNSQTQNDNPFIFKLLGQQKYPPSQLFLLMTLGPVIALIPWAQKIKGWFADVIIIIGRVPMFYYLLHILLIHLTAFVVNLIIFGTPHQDWYETAPFVLMADENRWPLSLLYLVWAIDVIILYFACRWYSGYKSLNRDKVWVQYL
jgi:uncharacterized membrane protein